jgi:hypothetical protein
VATEWGLEIWFLKMNLFIANHNCQHTYFGDAIQVLLKRGLDLNDP